MSSQVRSKLKVLATATIFLSAGLVSSPRPAFAANSIGVTTSGDSIDPSDGVISLREAFEIANSDGQDSFISLQPNTNYTLAVCLNGSVAHTATDDLQIEGNGASIQQSCTDSRIITNSEPASTLTLRNLSLGKDGYPSQAITGAAIWVDGPLRLLNVQIRDVHSGPANGSGDSIVFGGDLFGAGRPDIQVVGGSYTRNSGDVFRQSGGGLTISGQANVGGNRGFGVRLVDGSPVSITDSTIIGNSSGGVLTTGQGWTSLAITDSTIADNGGTGVTCSMCNEVRFDNVTVENNGTNHAIWGGGVSITTNDHAPTRSFRFLNSSITNNYSNRAGGGVRVQYVEAGGSQIDTPVVTFDNVVVSGNQTANEFGTSGAGIYAESVSIAIVNGSTIRDNIVGEGKTTWAIDGGGVHVGLNANGDLHPGLTVLDSEITGNQASGRGGGVSVLTQGRVDIQRSFIANNVADSGGGIAASGASLHIDQSHIADNAASVGGGIAIQEYAFFAPGWLEIDNTTLSGNIASSPSSGGGGLFINVGDGGVNAYIRTSTFSHNSAGRYGGGVMAMQHSSATLRFVTMTDNAAPYGANVSIAARPLRTEATVFNSPLVGTNCDLTRTTKSDGDSFATDTSCDLSTNDVVVLSLTPTRQAELHEPLADNGGFAPTRMPLASTPFGGMIPNSRCQGRTDERGVSRPQGGGCEPGAVEIEQHTCVRPTPSWAKPINLPVTIPADFPQQRPLGGFGFGFGFGQQPITPILLPSCAR